MSSPKGYGSGSKLDRISSQFSTVEPVRLDQYGLSVLAHQFLYQVASLSVTSATTNVITSAAHGALKGDVIRFTSGVYSGREVKVYSVTINTITLMEDLATAPAAADTFLVTRHKYPMTDSSGNIQCTFSYTLNGTSQTVIRDTTVPANNRPLPVEMLDSGGNSVTTTLSGAFVIQDVILRNSSGVEKGTNANPISVAGTVASGAADSGNPVKAGGVYNSAAPTFTNGQRGDLQLDASGRLQTLATQSGNWDIRNITGTVSLPTGASTEATLAAASAKLPATLGQKAMAASMAVALASDQSAIPVTQSGTWNITNISGTVSLPTGAATSALQTTGNTTLSAISAQLPTALGAKTIANSLAVNIASDQTVPISAVSLPLPTGAALDATLSSMSGKLPATLGQKAMAASMAVAIASDQSAIPASQSGTWTVRNQDGSGTAITSSAQGSKTGLNTAVLGLTAVTFARNDYSSTNVTTAAYVQLVASLGADVQELDIAETGGNTLYLATGAGGSEVNQVLIPPGGQGRLRLRIASGTRVSVKAVATTSSVGELNINFLG